MNLFGTSYLAINLDCRDNAADEADIGSQVCLLLMGVSPQGPDDYLHQLWINVGGEKVQQ